MAWLAYLLPPVSGFIAYSTGRSARTRFHGLQAVWIGFIFPLALYAGSWLTPSVTRIVLVLEILVWLGLVLGSAIGRDPMLPFVGPLSKRAAASRPI
jgi:uncharacterized membrane protein